MPSGISFQIAGAKYLIPKAARVVSRYSTIKLSASLVSYPWSDRFVNESLGFIMPHNQEPHYLRSPQATYWKERAIRRC